VNKSCLFIFVDESGNFDFSPRGTKFWVLTAISTFRPFGRDELEKIKYQFLEKGLDVEYFHASEDKQAVRNEVFEFIKGLSDVEIDSEVIQKNKANPSLYKEVNNKKEKHIGNLLYERVLRTLLSFIFRRYSGKVGRVVVVLSSIFTRNKREMILKTVKKYFKREFKIPFNIFFHDCKSDRNSQIADYCCWAIYRKWEDGELRPYNEIKDKIKSEFDFFKAGNGTIYYDYKK